MTKPVHRLQKQRVVYLDEYNFMSVMSKMIDISKKHSDWSISSAPDENADVIILPSSAKNLHRQ
jgi:hypothetical protein